MRRILLAAFAVLLLHAAPSMAAECTNLALPANGGTASASSELNSARTASRFNNGRRENWMDNTYVWYDGTWNRFPDWAQIEWSSARTLDRIVLLGPIWDDWDLAPARTLRRVRVQYWDSTTSAWVDVVGSSGQDNPITDWVMPYLTSDGSEIKRFDVAPVTTTRIRALFEDSGDGYSYMDEIEAYDTSDGCADPAPECTNRALDGTASASSVHSSGSYPVGGVNNGRRESGTSQGYWNDGTNGSWPDWVQIAWPRALTIDRVVARIPLAGRGFPLGEITLRRTRIQYWDSTTSAWVDVVGSSGQDNPILDWSGPIDVYDGSESRSFDLANPVTTTKIRALIEDGSTDGWSWLDELEAYEAPGDCAAPTPTPRDVNLALDANGGTPRVSSNWNASWYGPATINNGLRQTSDSAGFWRDSTYYRQPDWAAIEWRSPRQLNRIVARAPWMYVGATIGERTFGSVRIQYWDDAVPRWVDVVGRSGQDNPILRWVLPEGAIDGSEIKQFDFTTVSTRRVRVLLEEANSYGYSYLEELEAYWIS